MQRVVLHVLRPDEFYPSGKEDPQPLIGYKFPVQVVSMALEPNISDDIAGLLSDDIFTWISSVSPPARSISGYISSKGSTSFSILEEFE